MHVEVWSDFACPWCYIGYRRLEQALAGLGSRHGIEVAWRSFELGPERSRSPDRAAFEILTQDFDVAPDLLLARFHDIARLGAGHELGPPGQHA